jgi:hypothetical protein
LKAQARVTDAEERLSDMFDKAESFLRSLRDQPSIPFDPNNWPEDSAVAAALRERREAQRAFNQANAALSPADRKLLKSIPTDFLMTSSFPGRLESNPALGHPWSPRFNCLRASIRHSAQSGTAAPAQPGHRCIWRARAGDSGKRELCEQQRGLAQSEPNECPSF